MPLAKKTEGYPVTESRATTAVVQNHVVPHATSSNGSDKDRRILIQGVLQASLQAAARIALSYTSDKGLAEDETLRIAKKLTENLITWVEAHG